MGTQTTWQNILAHCLLDHIAREKEAGANHTLGKALKTCTYLARLTNDTCVVWSEKPDNGCKFRCKDTVALM